MAGSKAAEPDILRPSKPAEGSAHFGNSVSVQINADNLNIHPSSISALERIAEKSPEIASQLIKASELAVRTDGRKYITAAIASAVVALTIIGGMALVIITKGVVAGLMFFLACVAACAILTAFLTGKAQDISSTVRLLGRRSDSGSPDQS